MRAIIATIAALAVATTAVAADKPRKRAEAGQVILFNGQEFTGEYEVFTKDEASLQLGFTVGSIAIAPGERWELCQDTRFRGTCLVFDADETKLGRVDIRSLRKPK